MIFSCMLNDKHSHMNQMPKELQDPNPTSGGNPPGKADCEEGSGLFISFSGVIQRKHSK